jgi:hypothetical protein
MACRFCVVWRIGGQKSHPEFHRVRGECCYIRHIRCDNMVLIFVMDAEAAACGDASDETQMLRRAGHP